MSRDEGTGVRDLVKGISLLGVEGDTVAQDSEWVGGMRGHREASVWRVVDDGWVSGPHARGWNS